MRIAALIARYLLGFMFLLFGVNGFLHFLHQPPPPSPVAMQFFQAVSVSHFMVLVFAVQIAGGVLLLAGRFVSLGLLLLAPVIVNILNYHITMDPGGIAPGLVAALLWLLAFVPQRLDFLPFLRAKSGSLA